MRTGVTCISDVSGSCGIYGALYFQFGLVRWPTTMKCMEPYLIFLRL